MVHRMILNERSYFGAGARFELPVEIKARGLTKGLLVTDADLIKFGVAQKVERVLAEAGLACEVFGGVKQNPTVAVVKEAVAAYKRAGADYLVAVGGGSPIDTAKAVGIIINNPEFADVVSLEGVAPTKKPSVPLFALPTTAGTAAEVTVNYVITDEAKKRKFVCVDPHDIPAVAFVDAELMATMPKGLAAATGMDALTHAIEGFITKGAWAMTDMLHLRAIELIAQNLHKAVNGDAAARENMALAQYMAGMGFSNVGLGIVHSMAHPLGAFYDTPHGVANAVLLPYVMAYNAGAAAEKLTLVAKAMGADISGLSPQQGAQAAVDAVKALAASVGIPAKLEAIGVKKEDIPALAQSAFADVCTGGNPCEVSPPAIEALYQKAYE